MKSKFLLAALAAAALAGATFAAPASAAPTSAAPSFAPSADTARALAAAGCTISWNNTSGGWYAGYSNTNTTNTKRGQTGDRVREVQCLLTAFAGEKPDSQLSPGGVDGQFGANTEDAVVRAQKAYFFPRTSSEWDGEVGSKTWPKLRRFTDYV